MVYLYPLISFDQIDATGLVHLALASTILRQARS